MLFIQAPCGQNKHYPSESYPPSTRIIAIKASQRVKFCPLFGISYRANNYERMRVGMLKKEQKVRPIIRKVTRSPRSSCDCTITSLYGPIHWGGDRTHYTRVEPSRFPPRVGWPIVRSPTTLTSAVLPALSARWRAGRNSSGRSTCSP